MDGGDFIVFSFIVKTRLRLLNVRIRKNVFVRRVIDGLAEATRETLTKTIYEWKSRKKVVLKQEKLWYLKKKGVNLS